jgi:hypothetical protein
LSCMTVRFFLMKRYTGTCRIARHRGDATMRPTV